MAQPSDQVLDAIARALRLAPVERRYLHNVIRSTVTATPDDFWLAPLDAGTRTMLDSLQTTAFVIDIRGDVHWMNRMGRALLVGLEPMPASASSHPRWLFRDESTRALFTDWEMNARASVGTLRETAGRYPRDTRLQALIGELSVASPEFRSWWASGNPFSADFDLDTLRGGGPQAADTVLGGFQLAERIPTFPRCPGRRWRSSASDSTPAAFDRAFIVAAPFSPQGGLEADAR